jgi:streptomycin 6-kinase
VIGYRVEGRNLAGGGSFEVRIATSPAGRKVVIKRARPGTIELEANALRAFTGLGGVARLIERPADDVLITEWVAGRPAREEPDHGASRTVAVAELARQLHAAPTRALRPLERSLIWSGELASHNSYRHARARERLLLLRLMREIADSPAPRVALHGDLTNDNVIVSGPKITAIDAKGIVGPAAWDLVTFPIRVVSKADRLAADPRELLQEGIEAYGSSPPLLAECFSLYLIRNCAWRRAKDSASLAWLEPLLDELLALGDARRFAFC